MQTSSKGNQYKFQENGYWYKADYLGYESLAECLTSRLLQGSNHNDFVSYEIEKRKIKNQICIWSKSLNFLEDGESLVTLQRFFRAEGGIELHKKVLEFEDRKDRIQYVVDFVQAHTGISDFGPYLTAMLELDAVTADDDRHFHNIALIYKDGTWRLPPLFDFGAAWLSDITVDYPMDGNIEDLLELNNAKPFSTSYEEQTDAAEALYGVQLKIFCTADELCSAVDQLGQEYGPEIQIRVKEIVRAQMRKYRYLCNQCVLF